jgi:hypothetical protein
LHQLYNEEWGEWLLRNSSGTKDDLIEKMIEMSNKYGFDVPKGFVK